MPSRKSSHVIRVRDKEFIKSVSEEFGLPVSYLVDIAVRVLRFLITDDVLFYNAVTVIHYSDEDLANELMRVKGRIGSEA